MIFYITHLKDVIGNNYLGLEIPVGVLQPYLNELKDILGEDVYATNFLPSIPNLVYQYNLYVNYQSNVFSKKNPEIPE